MVATWWRANRPRTPDLFAQELEEAAINLATRPDLGRPYETVRLVDHEAPSQRSDRAISGSMPAFRYRNYGVADLRAAVVSPSSTWPSF